MEDRLARNAHLGLDSPPVDHQSNARPRQWANEIVSRVGSGRGLIVAGVVLAILVITLTPSGNNPSPPFLFYFVIEQRWLADGILNICLFAPFGLAVGWNSRSPLKAILAGLLLSTGVELAQTIIPGRDPSLSDIVFNTVGAALGALIASRPRLWLAPSATQSVFLTTISIVAVALVMGATALLLSPVQPPAGEKLAIAVIREGDDLLLRYPSRGAAVGLDEPEYWASAAFRGESAGDKMPLSLSRERARWHIATGLSNRATLGPTVGQGWTLLAYPDAIARRWGGLLSGMWMLALFLPIGFWARGRLWPIAAVAVVALLALIPRLTGSVATSSTEWAGAGIGLVTGAQLAWVEISRRGSVVGLRATD